MFLPKATWIVCPKHGHIFFPVGTACAARGIQHDHSIPTGGTFLTAAAATLLQLAFLRLGHFLLLLLLLPPAIFSVLLPLSVLLAMLPTTLFLLLRRPARRRRPTRATSTPPPPPPGTPASSAPPTIRFLVPGLEGDGVFALLVALEVSHGGQEKKEKGPLSGRRSRRFTYLERSNAFVRGPGR